MNTLTTQKQGDSRFMQHGRLPRSSALEPIWGWRLSSPLDIDEMGRVIGMSTGPSGDAGRPLRPAMWTAGRIATLEDFSQIVFASPAAFGRRFIVGNSQPLDDLWNHAWILEDGQGLRDLGSLRGGFTFVRAAAGQFTVGPSTIPGDYNARSSDGICDYAGPQHAPIHGAPLLMTPTSSRR